MVKFTTAIDHGGQRATNLAPPSATTDAATKAYVDGLAGGSVTNVGGTAFATSPAVGSWYLDTAPSTGSLSQSESELDITPRFLPAGTYDNVAVNVSAAGSAGAVFRVAVYTDANGYPGTLAAQSIAIDATTTGVRSVTLVSPLVIPAGGAIVWAGVVTQGGATTRPSFTRSTGTPLNNRLASTPASADMATFANTPNYFASSVTGSPPSTWSATGRGSDGARLGFRVSVVGATAAVQAQNVSGMTITGAAVTATGSVTASKFGNLAVVLLDFTIGASNINTDTTIITGLPVPAVARAMPATIYNSSGYILGSAACYIDTSGNLKAGNAVVSGTGTPYIPAASRVVVNASYVGT